MYEICLTTLYQKFDTNLVMVGAVDEFFERFLTSTLAYLGLKHSRGVFVLEKNFIKKEGSPK